MGQETRTYRSRLEQILDEEGRRQSWLAASTGIGPSRINYIVGGFQPPEDEQRLIAEALRREVADVFGPVRPAVAA